MASFKHPLPLDTQIKANKPNCPCKGGGTTSVTGYVKKVINNQTGYWYYLSSGSTVNANWITDIL